MIDFNHPEFFTQEDEENSKEEKIEKDNEKIVVGELDQSLEKEKVPSEKKASEQKKSKKEFEKIEKVEIAEKGNRINEKSSKEREIFNMDFLNVNLYGNSFRRSFGNLLENRKKDKQIKLCIKGLKRSYSFESTRNKNIKNKKLTFGKKKLKEEPLTQNIVNVYSEKPNLSLSSNANEKNNFFNRKKSEDFTKQNLMEIIKNSPNNKKPKKIEKNTQSKEQKKKDKDLAVKTKKELLSPLPKIPKTNNSLLRMQNYFDLKLSKKDIQDFKTKKVDMRARMKSFYGNEFYKNISYSFRRKDSSKKF